MTKQEEKYPEEVQLVRDKRFHVTNPKVIEALEGMWTETFLWAITDSNSLSLDPINDYWVYLQEDGTSLPRPLVYQYGSDSLIDMKESIAIPSQIGFHALFGLEDKDDEFDVLRKLESLALAALLHGFIESPKNPKKLSKLGFATPDTIKYIALRRKCSYEGVLRSGNPCIRPDLYATAILSDIEIPDHLIRVDPKNVETLAAEIAAHGSLINPITVVFVSRGKFRLIAGRRRYAACKLLGWSSIPVRIIAGDEADLIKTQIIENDGRLDMDPFTRADAYKDFKHVLELKSGPCTNKDLASALGVTPQRVSEVLKLLNLTEEHREQVRELGLGHRATVDLVREMVKSENSGDHLKEIKEQKTASTKEEVETAEARASSKKTRRKACHFEQDGFDVTIKSPSAEAPSKEAMIATLEAVIEKLKVDQMS